MVDKDFITLYHKVCRIIGLIANSSEGEKIPDNIAHILVNEWAGSSPDSTGKWAREKIHEYLEVK